MPHAALDEPVLISAGELLGVDTGVRVWRTVGITFKSDGRHRDIRKTGKAPFQIVIPRLAFSEPQPPAVVVDHDANMIRIRSEEHTSELQSLMRISYAVFCLKKQISIIELKNITIKPH